MHRLVDLLQTGIILTTPIFFLVTLVVLWRMLRSMDAIMAVAVHVKRQIEVLGRGGLSGGVRPTDTVTRAEKRFHPGLESAGEDHSG